jgi:tryptophan synthase alpha chain
MKRLTQAFANKTAFIPYIMGGDPSLHITGEMLLRLDRAGADVLELGMPFSDPQADGPVIQAAGQRALEGGTTLDSLFALLESLKGKLKAPVVLMGYCNPVYRYGKKRFAQRAASVGVAGILVPDLPLDEDPEWCPLLESTGIAPIGMVSPNMGGERLRTVTAKSRGFVYGVSLLGVTGDSRGPRSGVEGYLRRVKEATDLPVALGFGIDSPEKAAEAAKYAEGVVVGSALVKLVERYGGNREELLQEVGMFAGGLKEAIEL